MSSSSFFTHHHHRVGGKFEVQQFASIVNFLRSGRRDENFNIENPFAIFLEREEFQLYRCVLRTCPHAIDNDAEI
jgi:hypothetical protein